VDLDNGDEEKQYGAGTQSNAPGGANMFYTREGLERNGPFRTDLGPTGKKLGFSEDTEFCVRFQKRGEVSMYIPGAAVYHPVHKERLEKEYILKWLYNCGKSEVRRAGGYTGSASAFGVPRYLYRKLLQHASGSLLSFHQRTRVYHKLRLYYTAGELIEHLRINAGQSRPA
jgi:GT2 family glycosyltransferase